MREIHIPQISIFEHYGEHETAVQLKTISTRLDNHPEILQIAAGSVINRETKNTGRPGLSVDSILRAAILKQAMDLTYNELSFYLMDSISYSSFVRIQPGEPLSASALQANISLLSASCWEQIGRVLLAGAAAQGIEKGRTVRIDSTVIETNIHAPTDSSLLWDCVRTMVVKLNQLKGILAPGSVYFCNHSRAAKKKERLITFCRGANKSRLYKELLALTQRTQAYLRQALSQPAPVLQPLTFPVIELQAQQLLALTDKVVQQTQRRVFHGEKVPHQDKVFSIFEAHTDIIIKGSRDIQYGHKVNFTTGKSGLVLDVVIEQGNPADTARLCPMLKRQEDIYGRVPRQAAADGGYASKDNLAQAKAMGVKDVAFNKKRGIKIEDMTKSQWVYKRLAKFRAGIEGNISCLKRRYGLSRCTWKGQDKFKAYVWASTVAYNLMLFARLDLAIE